MTLLKLSFQVLVFFRTLWLTTCTTDCLCYTFNTQDKSWSESRSLCKQGEGDLVTMETEEKWKFINSKIQGINLRKNEWHIGLEKKGTQWKWVNNQILSIQKWQINEPNNGDCVAMAKNYPPGTQGLFKDLRCHEHLMYICEYRHGNPRCKDGYYPPGCNETDLISTTTELTQFVFTSTKPTQIRGATAIYKTRATISTTKNQTNLVRSTTPTYLSKNTSKPFPNTLVLVFVGILLAVFICLIIAVCLWKTGVMSSRSKHKKDSQRNTSEIAEVTGIELNEERTSSRSTHQNTPEIDAVIYAGIKDDHARSNPETSTYAEVHDCLSPRSVPVPEYPAPYEALEQNKGLAYQSLDRAIGGDAVAIDADYEIAPASARENRNGVLTIDPDEQITVVNAIYATVDKSMKNKATPKQVEPVYAQVNKNDETKIKICV